jgi:hypothetical protein
MFQDQALKPVRRMLVNCQQVVQHLQNVQKFLSLRGVVSIRIEKAKRRKYYFEVLFIWEYEPQSLAQVHGRLLIHAFIAAIARGLYGLHETVYQLQNDHGKVTFACFLIGRL